MDSTLFKRKYELLEELELFDIDENGEKEYANDYYILSENRIMEYEKVLEFINYYENILHSKECLELLQDIKNYLNLYKNKLKELQDIIKKINQICHHEIAIQNVCLICGSYLKNTHNSLYEISLESIINMTESELNIAKNNYHKINEIIRKIIMQNISIKDNFIKYLEADKDVSKEINIRVYRRN